MLVARDIQGDVNDIVPMKIVLENVTTGISGFQLTIQVDNPSVAIIESIVFPNYAAPTGFSFTSTIPSPPTASTTVTAVDLGAAIEPDSPSPYVLFTLQIKLLISASTTSVTVSSVGKLNDDSGADIILDQLVPGSVTIN